MGYPTFESLESRTLLSTTSIERVSVDSNGIPGDAHSDTSAISSDGRFVVFLSSADNLVAGDTAGHQSVFLRDRQLGTTARVSLAIGGGEPDGNCFDPSISSDGRYIAFSSNADNLTAGDTNGRSDVFVYDTQTQTTRLVSAAADGTQGDFGSFSPSISGDGTLVTFQSDADNLVPSDTNNKSDVFVYDLTQNAPQLISADSLGNEGDATSYDPHISGNGRFVAFLSDATNLVANDTNSASDVFVFDRQTGAMQRVSASSSGVQANASSGRIAISSDGRFVAFESDATNLVPGDTNGTTDIFLFDRQNSTIRRVSTASDGTQAVGTSTSPAISDDGEYVAFTSDAANLVTGDTNAKTDIFLFDSADNSVKRVSVGPNDLQGDDDSDFASLSGDGRYTGFFSNATNLVPFDSNGVGDVFLKDRLAAPHAEVTGAPNSSTPLVIPTADVTPLDIDGTNFGTVDIAGGGLTRTFTIRNSGADTLMLTGSTIIKIDGAGAADFTVTQQPASTALLPDQTTTFQITFHPGTVISDVARVTFTSNDTAAPLYTFRIAGTGVDLSNTTRLAVTEVGASVANGSTVSFGSFVQGSIAVFRIFTVTNTSDQTITLSPLSLTAASGFAVNSQLGQTTLAPAQSTTFSLFLPTTSAGNATGVVTLTNTAADVQSFTFNVAGAVTASQASVTVDGGAVVTSGQTIAFGPTMKSQGGLTKTFTVRNDGTSSLTLGTPSVPAGFSLAASTLKTLAPRESATFSIRLDANVLGPKSGEVTFTTNDPNIATFSITVSGSVVTPSAAITLDGVSLTPRPATSFGSVTLGQTAPSKTFVVTNLGTATLTLGTITLPAGFTLTTPPAASLALGESTTFVVTLNADTVGSYSGTLSLPTNDPADNPFALPISGQVVAPPVTAHATLLVDGSATQTADFGILSQNAGGQIKTITIRNDGTGPLTLSTPTAPSGYVLSTLTSTIQPGASASFTVALRTSTPGNFSSSLTITTNDPSASRLTVALSATVNAAAKTGISADSVTLAPHPPSVILGGAKTKSTATVALTNNAAVALSGTYSVTIYASVGTTPNTATDVVLGTASVSINLKPHAGTTTKVNITFPIPKADGTFNILAVLSGPKADPSFNIAHGSTIQLVQPIAHIGGPAQPAAGPAAYALGAKVNLPLPLTNQGYVALKGKTNVDVFISRNGGTTPGSAFKLSTVSGINLSLAAHGSQKVPLKLALPKKLPAGFSVGTYQFVVRLGKITTPTKYTLLNNGLIAAGTFSVH